MRFDALLTLSQSTNVRIDALVSLHHLMQRDAIALKNDMLAVRNGDSTWGSRYCAHGSYIGSWDGPDYLCGACEAGVSDYEYALGIARATFDTRVRALKLLIDSIVGLAPLEANPYTRGLAAQASEPLWTEYSRLIGQTFAAERDEADYWAGKATQAAEQRIGA